VAGGAVLIVAFAARPRRAVAPEPPLSRSLARRLRRAFPRGILGRHVAGALLVFLLAAGAWSAHEARTDVVTSLVVVRDPSAADGERAAAPGQALPRTLQIGSLGLLPTVAILEPASDGIRIGAPTASIAPWSVAQIEVHQVGGPTVGLQDDHVSVWRYPAVLPDAATVWLHHAAPGSPDLALAGLCALAGYAWFRLLGVANRPVARWLGIREGWL
jgi:hypothetical protein